MQYCHNCKVNINGNKKCCPLCQGTLSGEAEPLKEAYPTPIPPKYNSPLLLKLINFTAVAIIVIAFAVNIMIPTDIWWSLFVAGGTVCAWITVSVSIIYRKKLFKNITWQLFIITGLALLWDTFTGWLGWSLDYVIPCCCAATTISIIIPVSYTHLDVYKRQHLCLPYQI